MDKKLRLKALKDDWKFCTRCELHELRGRQPTVFGAGDPNAELLVVASAPGEDDMTRQRALAGERGALFKGALKVAGFNPDKIYATTVVGCRPFVRIPATEEEEERIQDRQPNKEELEACLPRLHEIIYAVDPRLIVALGEKSWKLLVTTKDRGKDKTTVARAHGALFKTHVPGRLRTITYPVLALVSPQQLINNPSTAAHGPIATTTKALQKAARYLDWLKRTEQKDLE